MPDEPVKNEEPQGNPPENKEPAKVEEPKKEQQDTPQDQIDWEKRYKDLQSAFNKRDSEVKEVSTLKEEVEKWRKLGAVIESDEQLFNGLKSKLGQKEEAKKTDEPKPDESKVFLRDNIVERFEDKKGISKLEPEKAKALRERIGSELKMMLAPYGSEEQLDELMLKVPLNTLPMYFEKAYKLATADDTEEQARLRTLAEVSENANGMFGSMPSSSVNPNQIRLTDKERETARKLGISEKDYIEYKAKGQQ